MDFRESFRGKPLAEQDLAACVPNDVNPNAAERGADCGEQDIKQKARAVVVDVADEDGIERHAEKRAVDGGKREYPPGTKRSEQMLNPVSVGVDKMFDLMQ